MRILILLVGVAMGYREAASAQDLGFDTNDVSILFPLKNGQTYPEIKLSDLGHLLTPEIFASVLTFEYPTKKLAELPYTNISRIASLSNWRVTSLRFDPCGDELVTAPLPSPKDLGLVLLSKQGENCQPRLRVVAQPVNPFGSFFASALHLIVRLDPDKTRSVIRRLASIKSESAKLGVATSPSSLAPHPGLAAEAANGQASQPIARIAREILLNEAQAQAMDVVTLILTVDVRHWKFVGGFIQNRTWTRFVTPLGQAINSETPLPLHGVEELQCTFYDICLSQPQNPAFEAQLLTRIFQKDRVTRPALERQEEATTRLAEIIDGPESHLFSTNCISCHQASNYRNHDKLYVPEKLEVPGITPFVERKWLGYSPSSVINFGYDGKLPRISTRTAFESQLAAKRANALMGWVDPGYRPRRLEDFWTCLLITKENCFSK